VHPLLRLDGSEVGLEHHVEFAGLGPLAGVAGLRVADVGQPVGRWLPVLGLVGLDEVVGAVALVGDQRFDQRVIEDLDVAGCDPHLARQDDRRIETHHVVTAGDHRTPPLPFDVLFELDPQRTVVPRRFRAAVDLAGGEDKSAAFGQVDYGVDDGGHGLAHSLSGSDRTAVVRRTKHQSW
jgi:hypothetical protein